MLLNISDVLYELDFFEKVHEIIYIFTADKLEAFTQNVEEISDNPTGCSYLHKMLDYFQRFLKSFIQIIYAKIIQINDKHKGLLTDLLARLLYLIFELHSKKMIGRMFDIILDAEEIDINIIHEIRESTEKSHMVLGFILFFHFI